MSDSSKKPHWISEGLSDTLHESYDFFFFINYIFLNLFFEVKQMPSSLKNTHSQLR